MNTTNREYFTFNVHNSALVVGQTGSGKTELVRQYIHRLERAFRPNQMKYVIYDLKQVEFVTPHEGGAKKKYLFTNIRTGMAEDMNYLEELADLARHRALMEKPIPFLFIYIEECDLAVQYPGRFHAAIKVINKNAERANMKLIFSTSRPSPEVIPEDFRDSFDLILSGTLASQVDADYLGIPGGTLLKNYEFAVKENKHA